MHCASVVLNVASDRADDFEQWNELADIYQIQGPSVFGGDTIVTEGP